jgi:hypothetical protein
MGINPTRTMNGNCDSNAAYNATAVADANPNVAVTDLRAVLNKLLQLVILMMIGMMTTDLVLCGLISLYGFHLTSRGWVY